jgi:chitin synthase
LYLPAWAWTLTDRRVEGEIRSKGHDDKTAVFDGTTIPLRRWEDWEKSRLRKLKREEKRRRDFERQFGATYGGTSTGDGGSSDGHGYSNSDSGRLVAPPAFGNGIGNGLGRGRARSEYESDAGSVFSGDEDIWGAEIGGVSDFDLGCDGSGPSLASRFMMPILRSSADVPVQ